MSVRCQDCGEIVRYSHYYAHKIDCPRARLMPIDEIADEVEAHPPHDLQDGETCPVCGCMGNGEG